MRLLALARPRVRLALCSRGFFSPSPSLLLSNRMKSIRLRTREEEGDKEKVVRIKTNTNYLKVHEEISAAFSNTDLKTKVHRAKALGTVGILYDHSNHKLVRKVWLPSFTFGAICMTASMYFGFTMAIPLSSALPIFSLGLGCVLTAQAFVKSIVSRLIVDVERAQLTIRGHNTNGTPGPPYSISLSNFEKPTFDRKFIYFRQKPMRAFLHIPQVVWWRIPRLEHLKTLDEKIEQMTQEGWDRKARWTDKADLMEDLAENKKGGPVGRKGMTFNPALLETGKKEFLAAEAKKDQEARAASSSQQSRQALLHGLPASSALLLEGGDKKGSSVSLSPFETSNRLSSQPQRGKKEDGLVARASNWWKDVWDMVDTTGEGTLGTKVDGLRVKRYSVWSNLPVRRDILTVELNEEGVPRTGEEERKIIRFLQNPTPQEKTPNMVLAPGGVARLLPR